jgi:hypothetical protein
MTPGSILFDRKFSFHDGEVGEKLFVILGTKDGTYVVAKTTTKQHGRGTTYGCQPDDRFHNFFLPKGCCHLKETTWVCLDEFYEFSAAELLKKGLDGVVAPICTIPAHLRALQECALQSLDITGLQAEIVRACLV